MSGIFCIDLFSVIFLYLFFRVFFGVEVTIFLHSDLFLVPCTYDYLWGHHYVQVSLYFHIGTTPYFGVGPQYRYVTQNGIH